MGSKFMSDIIQEYEKSRSSADDVARNRQLEVYKKIPRIKEIDTELSYMGLDVTKSILKKDADIDKLIERLHQKSIDLKMEKGELLMQNSFPIDFPNPKYKCKDCSDTGYIDTRKCNCLKQKIIDKYYNQSNLKKILPKENFDTFMFEYYSVHKFGDEALSPRKNIEKIYSASIEFVDNFDNTADNLFFLGKSGLGKTFLSNCISKDLLDRGKLVIYQTASTIIEVLKNAKFDDTNSGVRDTLDNIFDCDLLIIDDLGTEYTTDFTQVELFNIINRRLIAGKKMLISTNLSLDNIVKIYPERITSRVFGNFTVYKFYGEDIRMKIGEQKRKKDKK